VSIFLWRRYRRIMRNSSDGVQFTIPVFRMQDGPYFFAIICRIRERNARSKSKVRSKFKFEYTETDNLRFPATLRA